MAARVESSTAQLESLLNEFGTRRWSGQFTKHDVQAILGLEHDCQEIISQGVAAGLFTRDRAGYCLTTVGGRKVKTLRTGRDDGGENPEHPSSPQRDLSIFTRVMAPVDPDEKGTGGHALSRNRERPHANGSCDSHFLERALDPRGSAGLSENSETGQIPRRTVLFESPMDDSQNLESQSSFSLFGADSDFLEKQGARAHGVQNSEGVRKYNNECNVDLSDQTIDLDNPGSDQAFTRASARSKRDTRTKWVTRREERLTDLKKNARALIGKRTLHVPHEDHVRMRVFAEALDRIRATYKGSGNWRKFELKDAAQEDSDHKFYKLCVRGAKYAESVGAEYGLYIKSQFHWFELKKGRAPKPWEVCDQFGVSRWESYQSGVRAGAINPATNVVTRVTSAPIPKHLRFERCDGILRALMRNYEVTEADAIRVFAVRNDGISFDQDWLDARPVYQQLKAEGAFEE